MIQDVTSHDTPFLVTDEKSAPENPSQENQVKIHNSGNTLPSIKTHDLISCLRLYGCAELGYCLLGNQCYVGTGIKQHQPSDSLLPSPGLRSVTLASGVGGLKKRSS